MVRKINLFGIFYVVDFFFRFSSHRDVSEIVSETRIGPDCTAQQTQAPLLINARVYETKQKYRLGTIKAKSGHLFSIESKTVPHLLAHTCNSITPVTRLLSGAGIYTE